MTASSASSKIAAALRQRFVSPRAALRFMGLDENLAPASPRDPSSGAGERAGAAGSDRLKALGAELQKLVADLDLDPGQREKIQSLLNKFVAFDESDEKEKLEKFGAFLKNLGLGDEDINKAMKLAAAGSPSGEDAIPGNAIGDGFGGKFSDRSPAMDERMRATVEKRLDDRFGIRRVYSEPSVRQAEDHRVVLGPSRSAIDRLDAKFGCARIGTC
jgi:hypothetical protein